MGAVLVCFGGQESDHDDIKQQSRVLMPSRHIHDEDEDPINWDTFMLQSNKSTASSGSRMLSAFYSRLLEENNDCAFYFNTKGKRMKGQYLDRVELVEDYFLPLKRKRLVPHSVESVEMDSSSDDCFSISSTLVSELDYCMLVSRPVLGRCSSLGPPRHASLKFHRAITSPHLQNDMDFAHLQSPSSSQSSELDNHQFPSPKSYLPPGELSCPVLSK